ncbi:MAG: citrate synthase 2, partial [Trebonia sp.]
GKVPFEQVWGWLVDESLLPGLPYEHVQLEHRTGGYISDLQMQLAALSGEWKLGQFIDIDDDQAKEDLRRLSAGVLSIVAQSARGADLPPVSEATVAEGQTAAERFLLEWRGEVNETHAKAIDTYWICTAEHGLNASTFAARIAASTGADCGAALSSAVGALSGPLHGGAPARVLHMIEDVERTVDAEGYVKSVLDRGDRLMGFGHRVYRAEDPRARVLRRTAKELGAPRYEVALALENAALTELRVRRPDRVLETNVEFWAAIVLDFAQIPAEITPSMFTCARTAGWAAHILEQKLTGRLVRPSARYVGPSARPVRDVPGAAEVLDRPV